MTPAPRTMPVVTATWIDGSGWIVKLPGDRTRICPDRAEVLRICDREASGASIHWLGSPPSLPSDAAVPAAGQPDEGLGEASRHGASPAASAADPALAAPAPDTSPTAG
jgi:hypothetical protein